jgi:hypothetical protein
MQRCACSYLRGLGDIGTQRQWGRAIAFGEIVRGCGFREG